MILFNHTCDIQRMVTTGEGISKTMQALYSNVSCLILPQDNQSSVDNSFEFGQGFEGYFDETQDIKKGDKVVWNGYTLIVQGVKPFIGVPPVSHIQVLLQKEEA